MLFYRKMNYRGVISFTNYYAEKIERETFITDILPRDEK